MVDQTGFQNLFFCQTCWSAKNYQLKSCSRSSNLFLLKNKMASKRLKLAACLLNISEAQNFEKVEKIARCQYQKTFTSLSWSFQSKKSSSEVLDCRPSLMFRYNYYRFLAWNISDEEKSFLVLLQSCNS